MTTASAFAGSTYEQERQQRLMADVVRYNQFVSLIRMGAAHWDVVNIRPQEPGGVNFYATVQGKAHGVRVGISYTGHGNKIEVSMAALTQSGKTYYPGDHSGFHNGSRIQPPRASFTLSGPDSFPRIIKGALSRVLNTLEAVEVNRQMHAAADGADRYKATSKQTTEFAQAAMQRVGFREGVSMRTSIPGPQQNGREERDGRVVSTDPHGQIEIDIHGEHINIKLGKLTLDELRNVLAALKA